MINWGGFIIKNILKDPEPSFDTLKSAQKQKTLISKKSATNP